jgi:hypothetical protein
MSVRDAPAFLRQLRRLNRKATNRQLDAMPIDVRHLSNDVVSFFAHPPALGGSPFDIESTNVCAISQPTRKHTQRSRAIHGTLLSSIVA